MMAVKLEKKLLRTIANRKMLGKDREFCLSLHPEVTKRVYFIGNERMLIAHDSNRLRFS